MFGGYSNMSKLYRKTIVVVNNLMKKTSNFTDDN